MRAGWALSQLRCNRWERIRLECEAVKAPSLDHVGPLTRSAKDAAVMLCAIAGADENDPTARSESVPAIRRSPGKACTDCASASTRPAIAPTSMPRLKMSSRKRNRSYPYRHGPADPVGEGEINVARSFDHCPTVAFARVAGSQDVAVMSEIMNRTRSF
jgi:hypothetical protein